MQDLKGHKGTYIGFFENEKTPCSLTGHPGIQGYWEYKSGGEGGELHIDLATNEVEDFDGAFDLPKYVKEELASLGLTCPWGND